MYFIAEYNGCEEALMHPAYIRDFDISISFFARDSVCCKRAYAIAIPSVCLSVRHMGGSVKNG